MVKNVRFDRRFVIPVLPISWFLCAATVLLFRSSLIGTPMQNHILPQTYAVCILFAAMDAAFFLKIPAVRLTAFLIKLFCIFFLAKALAFNILALICISFCLFYEIWFFLGAAHGTMISVLSVIVLYLSTAPHSAWDILREGIDPAGLCTVFLVSVSASLAGGSHSRALEKCLEQSGDIRRLEETVTNLTKTNTAYQTYATYIEETSKEEERHRISREIHDIIGYSMTNLLMIVQAALYSKNQDQVTELLQKAQIHINESLEEVRQALHILWSKQKKPLHGTELIRYLTDNFQKLSGIRINLDFVSFPSALSARTEEILYRILQESMTNSFRHGKATKIDMAFWTSGTTFVVQIRDNGKKRPGNPTSEGIGLKGMRERIDEIGGTLTTEAVRDGFTVIARLPIEDSAREESEK